MLGDIEEAFGFLLFERNARGTRPRRSASSRWPTRGAARRTHAFRRGPRKVKRRGGHGQLTVGAIMRRARPI